MRGGLGLEERKFTENLRKEAAQLGPGPPSGPCTSWVPSLRALPCLVHASLCQAPPWSLLSSVFRTSASPHAPHPSPREIWWPNKKGGQETGMWLLPQFHRPGWTHQDQSQPKRRMEARDFHGDGKKKEPSTAASHPSTGSG